MGSISFIKSIISLTLWLVASSLCAQKLKAVESTVSFFSEAPLENIEAFNTQANSLINRHAKTIAIIIPIKGFQFEKSLMQEHFNENYLESEKYPYATFKGTITEWDSTVKSDSAVASGQLTLHGVTRNVEIKGLITLKAEQVFVNATFPIRLGDYKIKIPKLVWQKIAEEVDVTVKIEYAPYN